MYKHVKLFPRAFFILIFYRSKVFLLKASLLFLQQRTWIYGITVAVNENKLATKVVAIWALQLNDGPLALSVFAEHRTYLLKKVLRSSKFLRASREHHERDGTS